jgi:hypothetical protein
MVVVYGSQGAHHGYDLTYQTMAWFVYEMDGVFACFIMAISIGENTDADSPGLMS